VISLAKMAREKINRIDGLIAFESSNFSTKGCFGFDQTKLGINVTGIGLTGLSVYEILRDDYNIQIEMGDAHNILAILSIGDSEKEVNQLVSALHAISNNYRKDKLELGFKHFSSTEVKLSPRKAFYSDMERLLITESVGHISGEFVMIYPPGIPILAPGEFITDEIVEYIELLKKENGTLSGLEDTKGDYIYCIKEEA